MSFYCPYNALTFSEETRKKIMNGFREKIESVNFRLISGKFWPKWPDLDNFSQNRSLCHFIALSAAFFVCLFLVEATLQNRGGRPGKNKK